MFFAISIIHYYSKSPSHIIQPRASHALHATSSTTALSLQKHDFAFVKRSNGHYSYAILAYRTTSGDDSPSHHNDSMKSIDNNGKGGEEGMAFVMDNSGSTKMIRKKHWAEYVRLVAPQEEEEEEEDVTHHNVPGKPTSSSDNHQDDDDGDDVMLCQEIPIVCQEIVPPPMTPQQVVNRPQDMEAEEEEEVYLGGAKDDEACPLPSMISFIPSTNDANNEECSLISSVSDRARRVDRESIK